MPASIAIIGASADRGKFGNKAVRAYKRLGFDVYPINPRESEIEGLKAYASVLDLPQPPDSASFYVPPSVGLKVLDEVARIGVKQVWLNPGAESEELVRRANELGIQPIVACSIIGAGVDPEDL